MVSEPFRSFANTLVDICAYAGEWGSQGSEVWALCPLIAALSLFPQARGTS